MDKYTIKDFERDFPDDGAFLEWLKNNRWLDGIHCVKCHDYPELTARFGKEFLNRSILRRFVGHLKEGGLSDIEGELSAVLTK